MAPRVIFSLFSLVYLLVANSFKFPPEKFNMIMHPLNKDKTTNLYSIPMSVGNTYSVDYVIDLNGVTPLLLKCSTAAKSTTYHTIKCGSTICKYANPSFPCPNNSKTTCRSPDNAPLFRDTISLQISSNGVYYREGDMTSNFTLTCSDTSSHRTIGLANTHLSIPSQLSTMYKLPLKMALCLPSTYGEIWIGKGEYHFLPYRYEVSKLFVSTPLVNNGKSGGYLINVKSIEIGGKTVSILHGVTKISTLDPYTILETSIYKAIVTTFTENAKMTKVPAVKPFGACFRSNKRRRVPVIDLVMRGGAKWRIHGSNSMVKVNKHVVCLGFVDGGMNPKNPLVIGGYQMEDNLVEFDLEASKFSVSSSLLLHNTSCSVNRLSPF